MAKRFWVCGLVMSTAALLLGFIVHGLLLAPDYAALGAMFRSDDDSRHYAHWMVLAHVLIGFAMTWIYAQGFSDERSSSLQGLRFGLAMALFSTLPGYLIYYAVQPLPAALRSEEHTSELQSLMRISYAVFCLKKKHTNQQSIPHARSTNTK